MIFHTKEYLAFSNREYSAFAQWGPQRWGPDFGPGFNPQNGFPNGRGGDNNGAYYNTCQCTRDGFPDQWTTYQGCQQLGFSYPNLQYNGQGCIDLNRRGVEYNGFANACRQASNFGGWGNIDAQCY